MAKKNKQATQGVQGWLSRLNRIEKVFYGSILTTAIVLAVAIIFVQSKLLQVQSEMTQINSEMTVKNTELADAKQAVNERTRASYLKDIAAKKGLSLKRENIGVAE